jgi:hypothetical protein
VEREGGGKRRWWREWRERVAEREGGGERAWWGEGRERAGGEEVAKRVVEPVALVKRHWRRSSGCSAQAEGVGVTRLKNLS